MNYEIPDDLKFRKIDELNMKPQEIPFTQLRGKTFHFSLSCKCIIDP